MQQTNTKEYKIRHDWVGPLDIVQEIQVLPYYQIVYRQTKIYPWELKVGDCSKDWPEGSLFNSHYTKV